MRTPDLLHLVRYESGGPPLPPALLQEDGRAVRAALHGMSMGLVEHTAVATLRYPYMRFLVM